MSLSVALAALRTAYRALGAAIDVLELAARDDGDMLISLADGCDGLAGATLTRWARDGRLQAFEAERGRLVAWRSDVRRAIEARPCRPLRAVATETDALDRAVASGELRAGVR